MKTILITGASAGIGKACARALARNGVRLILSARNLEALTDLKHELGKKNTEVLVYQLDVRDRSSVEDLFATLEQKSITVDVLVNNAGLALGLTDIKDGDPEDWETMIDTNVKGLLYTTRAALPGMVERDKGHIVNVGSIAGTAAYAKGAVYCATKAAVRFISDALRQEVVAYNIRVTNIQPGMVETDFSKVRFRGNEDRAKAVYKGIEALTGDDVADVVAYAIFAPDNVQISELTVLPTYQASPGVVHRKDTQV